MARFRGALVSFVLAVSLAVPAAAQIGGRPFEISGTAGIFSPDMRARMETAPAYNGALGLRWNPGLTIELAGTWAPSRADTFPGQNLNFAMGTLDLRVNLRPPHRSFVPFLILGAGYGTSHTTGHRPDLLKRGGESAGMGLLVNAINQRTFLRFQVRDMVFRDRDVQESSHHIAATAGLQLLWGGKPMDQDRDGVRDLLDKCPNTPLGATVDANGCPHDKDGDGVLDGIDKCDDTPKGCTIDASGCQHDQDGDGVCDGLDQCPDTPKGATVDAHGCPSDADGDGVLDGIDKCNDTPKGCTIDANGCQSDADGDGVCDGLDKCPNTPAGLKVDPNGCPIEVSEKETQLLDTGSIRIQNINFDTGKATIKPESYAVIDTVARILVQYPTLVIEIGGHTDNTGNTKINGPLSQERADSVLAYLRAKFPGLNAVQYSAKGYGPDVPVAPNSSALGRAKNRRVEFRVMNTEALKIERERRRFLRKDEAAPPPAPPAPAVPAPPAPSDATKRLVMPGTPAPTDTTKRPVVPVKPAPPDTTKH